MLFKRTCKFGLLCFVISIAMSLTFSLSVALATETELTVGEMALGTMTDTAVSNIVEQPSETAFAKTNQKLKTKQSQGALIMNGTYYIVLDSDSSKVLGPNGSITAKNGSKSQRWKLTFDWDTQCYTIKNVSSKKVLTVASKGKYGSKVYERKLVKKNQRLSAYATRNVPIPTQRWFLRSNSNGYYLVSAANKRARIDFGSVQARVRKAGTKGVELYVSFIGVSGTYTKNGIGSGTYTVTSQANNKLLNITNSSVAKKAKARVGNGKTAWGQMFDFVYIGNGLYKILNYNTGYALTASGSRVVQTTYGGKMKKAQQWKPIIVGADGEVQFINRNGKALSVRGNSVVLQKSNPASVSQRWSLSPTTTGLTYIGKNALYWANKQKSKTKNCIVIDIEAHDYFLFEKAIKSKKGGPWVLIDSCRCASGRNRATEGGTKGSPYISTTDEYAVHKPGRINGKWCVSIAGGSDIHSITYDGAQGTNQLGWYLSGGCIRVPFKNAEYVFKHTTDGTKVVRYYDADLLSGLY